MKFYRLTEAASANIQCCGFWFQCRGTIIGIAPDWWFDNRNQKHTDKRFRPRRLGIKLWAWDHHGGVHTVFQIKTRAWSLRFNRAFASPSEDRVVGWAFERRRLAQ